MEATVGPVWAFVIEKLVAAGLLVIAGVIATIVVERGKTDWAYKAELAKMRVEAVGSTWAAAATFEAHVDELLRAVIAAAKSDRPEAALSELLPMEEESKRTAKAFKDVAYAKRFFLGEAHFGGFMKFNEVMMQRIEAVGNLDSTEFQRLESQIDSHRTSLENFVDIPFS